MVDLADGVSEGAAAEALEALDVGAGRVELVMRDGVGGGKLSAAGEYLRHVDCGFVCRRDERDIAPDYASDQRFQQRKMRAAEHERVDFATAQRVEVVLRDFLECGADIDLRRERGELLDGAFCHLDALLSDVDEARCCRGEDGDAGVDVANRLGVGVGFHRCLRGDDSHAAVLRCVGGGTRTWLDYADYGYGQRLLRVGKARRCCRVAGDHDHLHAAAYQPRTDLLYESVDLGKGPGTVGASRGIAQVDKGFMWQFLRDVACDGKPAEAGVEDADRRIACAGENGLGVRCGFHAWKYTPAVRVCSVHHNMTNGLFVGCVQESASGRSWGGRVAAIQKKLKKGLARIWGLVYSNQAAEARGVSSVG